MTGQELIDHIIQNGVQEEELFIYCDVFYKRAGHLHKLGNNLIISNKEIVVDYYLLRMYFSQWFDLIPFRDVEDIVNNGGRYVLLLETNGTDRYIDNYTLEELREARDRGCLFGLDRENKQ